MTSLYQQCLGLLLTVLSVSTLPAQTNTYILNGSATQDKCNCYTLTTASNFQSGSVWNNNKIDLHQPFDFSFNIFLGCTDGNGADGIVFILQTVANSVGTAGEGLGFQGVVPSIGIALDTWQNTNLNDPPEDHISIQANGVIAHGNDIAGPVSILPNGGNVEDCQWHILRISWDPATQFLRAYFDGVLRVGAQADLLGTIFNNAPAVYWGFSAATGGASNLQQFCTALNPGFTTNFSNNATCVGNSTIIFSNTSVSFAPIASYYWDFGDGFTSTAASPPSHTYNAAGLYTAKLAITGLDGCNSDTLQKVIAVGDLPVAAFEVYDTCTGNAPRITEHSSLSVGTITQWNWLLDGNPASTAEAPQLPNLPAGTHTLQLNVTSNYGCQAAATATRQFTIKQRPSIDGSETGVCIEQPAVFTAQQLDNATTISSWTWDFGDSHSVSTQNAAHLYTQPGNYPASLTAVAGNGCASNTVNIPVVINQAIANAGNDTVIIKDQPFQLHGTGGIAYTWSPATGMNDPDIANPLIILQDDTRYNLHVVTAEGCADDDDIAITVFKGSSIYMPTAFTPNGDGLNETIQPYYAGIKTLRYFMVYNRWGQVVFQSHNLSEGWDGTVRGVKQGTGVYAWRLRAIDYIGKVYEMSGTFTLVR